MSLLTIVQDALVETGIAGTPPPNVIGNTDPTTVQALALANRAGKALAARWQWQECMREFTHTTLAAELQGDVDTIMPGFNWTLYRTLWNRDLQEHLGGPLYPSEWQYQKASSTAGVYSDYRIRGNSLYMLPAPAAGETIAGEYASKYWCESSGGTAQARWAADTDTGLLDEDLLCMDLKWRLLRAKGMDYAEEKMEAEIQINLAMARNGSNRIINSGEPERERAASVGVPDGNWNL